MTVVLYLSDTFLAALELQVKWAGGNYAIISLIEAWTFKDVATRLPSALFQAATNQEKPPLPRGSSENDYKTKLTYYRLQQDMGFVPLEEDLPAPLPNEANEVSSINVLALPNDGGS
eukprot:GHVU01035777.1.p5 GENE.GHVU01035777.1~~GHVU01035777.1.p5  ORF type:complete len:117 (+),score=15.95 GHVU01035777.1:6772-7122(+)